MKVKSALLLLVTLSIFKSAMSQAEFQTTFGSAGNEAAYNILQTTDQGYFITGIYSDGTTYAIKTNSAGDTLWTKRYFSFYPHTNGLDQTTDGGFIIAGYRSDQVHGSNDFNLIKTDADGDTVWTNMYLGTEDNDNAIVLQTADGGYIFGGTTDSIAGSANQNYNLQLLKANSSGVFQWGKRYGSFQSGNHEHMTHIQELTGGGYIVLGRTNTYGNGDFDVYLLKMDATGTLLWSKTYGGTGSEMANSIKETNDGGFIISGTTTSFGAGSSDIYLVKTDVAGNVEWSTTYGGTGSETAFDVEQTADFGYIILGTTASFGAGGNDLYMVRVGNWGAVEWSKTYGGSGVDIGYDLTETADGGFAAVGSTSSFGAGNMDFYFVKTDESGNSGCNETTPVTMTGSAATVSTSPATQSAAFGAQGNRSPQVAVATLPLDKNTECTTVGVDEAVNRNKKMMVYPSPGSDRITISAMSDFAPAAMYDILGNVIMEIQATELSIAHLAPGIYFIRRGAENLKWIKE